MKQEPKKQQASAPSPNPQHVKQSSGDKAFDDAIDRMLKKPAYQAPAK
jgi:hypothetical protein